MANRETKAPFILGIETSCDETAAAIYNSGEENAAKQEPSKKMLSNVLFSQIELHKPYGGVVPEVASRSHIEKINTIVTQALDGAHLSLDDIGAIAVTTGPGLPGSLLVGLCFAKALAYEKQIPLVAVDHIEAHAFSPLIENNVPFPHICLTASGGHTALFYIKALGEYTLIGTTQDDAAGEAFDKVAKLIGLPYPGGPTIERLAREAEFKDFLHYPRLKAKTLDFSFSGLKTAVLYNLIEQGAFDLKTKTFLLPDDKDIKTRVASSFLVCVGDIFVDRILRALDQYPQARAITFAGGVACNHYLVDRLSKAAHSRRVLFFTPARYFCTDNAAMVAFVGSYKAQKGLFSDFSLDLSLQRKTRP